MAKDIAAFAAASNLITTTIGTYFTLFLSLPFTIWAYGVLEPVLGRGRTIDKAEAAAAPAVTAAAAKGPAKAPFGPPALLGIWVVVGFTALVGNYLGYKTPIDELPSPAWQSSSAPSSWGRPSTS